MDKDMFKSYKFKPSDVIEGLNRYFAETKAFRYHRVPLEIRRGVCYNNPDCVKDIVFGNNPPERATKAWCCWHYYLICDPEEVVGVAINWLREEHDIFYTPGMAAPIEDFDVDEAAKEYEKATRKDLKETLQRRLYEAKKRIVALEAGHAEKSKIIDRQVAMIKELEEQLREKTEENGVLRGNLDYFADLAQKRQMELLDNAERQLRWTEEVNKEWLKKYEKLKSELDEMKELYRGAAVGNGGLCEDLAKEREKVKRMEKKLIEIQDICER